MEFENKQNLKIPGELPIPVFILKIPSKQQIYERVVSLFPQLRIHGEGPT
jgi:hypothetical protein